MAQAIEIATHQTPAGNVFFVYNFPTTCCTKNDAYPMEELVKDMAMEIKATRKIGMKPEFKQSDQLPMATGFSCALKKPINKTNFDTLVTGYGAQGYAVKERGNGKFYITALGKHADRHTQLNTHFTEFSEEHGKKLGNKKYHEEEVVPMISPTGEVLGLATKTFSWNRCPTTLTR